MKKFTLFFVFAILASLMGVTAFGQNITQVGTTNATSGGTSITINKPGGLAVGDLMIASFTQSETSGGEDLSDVDLGGWTLVAGSKIGAGSNPEFWGNILYRVATASDVAAANFVFDLDDQAENAVGAIVAFRGVAVTGGVGGTPFDVAPGVINGLANDNTLSAASITTATPNAAVLMFGFIGNNPGINPAWTATSPATLNELFDVTATTSADVEMGAAWNVKATTGATGAGSATLGSTEENGAILLALRPAPATATLTPAGPISIAVGGSVNLTATANNFSAGVNYTFTWVAVGSTGLGTNPVIQAGNTNSKNLTYPVAGTYTVTTTISRGTTVLATNTVTINVLAAPSAPNLWASSSDGTQVSTFSVNNGVYFNGPTNLFAPTFPGTTTGGTTTAALGRSDKPSQANGFFYWLPNTSGNSGVVEVFGANATGGVQTRIGSIDVNGGGTNSLGFVRLAVGPDGTAWILAGDATTLYLVKFKPNGVTLNSALPAADQLVIVDASVTLTGGAVSTFQNGDICLAGDGNIVALANDGGGITQIFIGAPAGASTNLTKKFDVLDENAVAFTGSVNGVAFDLQGSLYVSAADGLYFINKNTVNGPAGTIAINQVWVGTGLQDLASNFFPTTIITPVKLGKFEVVKSGNNALLNWTTLTETNSSHFVIERSTDGVNFSVVGTVQAAGTTTDMRSYQFVDPITSLGSNIVYYRLRTVDLDAKADISKIVALRLNGKAVIGFKVFPNPFTNDLKIQISSPKEATVTVRINNAMGQPVVSRTVTLQSGENIIVLSSELASLNKGMYVMEIITVDGKQTEKIIKR